MKWGKKEKENKREKARERERDISEVNFCRCCKEL